MVEPFRPDANRDDRDWRLTRLFAGRLAQNTPHFGGGGPDYYGVSLENIAYDGSTLDLTLVHSVDGSELDMGTPFDTFSPKSWPSNTSVSREAQQNRAVLATAMQRRGFAPYNEEWWHFTLKGEPFPKTYFDFPVR